MPHIRASGTRIENTQDFMLQFKREAMNSTSCRKRGGGELVLPAKIVRIEVQTASGPTELCVHGHSIYFLSACPGGTLTQIRPFWNFPSAWLTSRSANQQTFPLPPAEAQKRGTGAGKPKWAGKCIKRALLRFGSASQQSAFWRYLPSPPLNSKLGAGHNGFLHKQEIWLLALQLVVRSSLIFSGGGACWSLLGFTFQSVSFCSMPSRNKA